MPDFVDAFEARLREIAVGSAVRQAPAWRMRAARWPSRFVLVAAACAVIVAVMFVVPATHRHAEPAAYGRPSILATAPVQADTVLKHIQHGMMKQVVLGEDARLTEVRAVPAFGGTAYVLTGDRGWCLTAPDPLVGDPRTADPTRTGGVTCLPTADVYRYGIYLGMGNNAIVALPARATPPTLELPDGTVRTLRPGAWGVVVVNDAPRGSVLTLFAADGSRRQVSLR